MAYWKDGIVCENVWRDLTLRLLIVCPEPNEQTCSAWGMNAATCASCCDAQNPALEQIKFIDPTHIAVAGKYAQAAFDRYIVSHVSPGIKLFGIHPSCYNMKAQTYYEHVLAASGRAVIATSRDRQVDFAAEGQRGH